MTREDKLEAALFLLLSSIDYTTGACRLNEMIGAILPKECLAIAREALKKDKAK